MARSRSKDNRNNTNIDVTCVHHWVIESPEGPISRGMCKFCGAEDLFQNYIPYPTWHDEKWKNRKLERTENNESYFS